MIDAGKHVLHVAHVAKAMGVSRQCAHRWINRFNEAGADGLSLVNTIKPGGGLPEETRDELMAKIC